MLRGEQCQEPSTGNLDLGRKLLDACKNGETDEVRDLMQNGAPFTTDWLGTSPLHFAAQYGHKDTAEFLLRSGVSRDTRTKVERTPLHVSSQEGHLEIVALLLMHGADIDARDLLKMTPLHWAVERGHYDVVECLLSNGADLNLLSKFDKTPIDIARDSGRTDMIPLLERCINVTRPRQDNRSTSNTNNSCFAKTRPTVLPNKSNRTAKIVKPIGSVNSNSTAKGNSSSSSSSTSSSSTITANISKTSVDALKKLLNGTGINLEDGSNNVLTTLAALADATGQTTGNVINNNSQIAADALQWLDTHGATSALEESMFTSAIESGGTVSLTEAGKLALNCVKDSSLSPTTSQQQQQTSSSSSSSVTTLNNSTKLDPDLEGKVIQIVGELENNQVTSPIVLLSSNSDGTLTTTTTDQTEPIRIKKIIKTVAGKPISVTNLKTTTNLNSSKLNLIESNGCKVISNAVASITSPSTTTTITINHNNNNTTSSPNVNNNIINLNNNNNNNNSNSDKEKERLRKELERTKREAEEYKAQLREKEKEAELYKRQLEVYKSKFKD
ncbi:putative uncharacterized protein DDB_G0277255 [Panonychus citri]|uniref:putative uncharacterized protein DDB_G0277255 n=1 Tax=Panonychus citri TaxID=50023 RepID=UPI0023072C86|nr:putative uncharacterized protein DDB_G0277255 [Panonychus citri]